MRTLRMSKYQHNVYSYILRISLFQQKSYFYFFTQKVRKNCSVLFTFY